MWRCIASKVERHRQRLGLLLSPNRARENKIYLNGSFELVEYKNRVRQKAYAMSNHKEYFAECTEAFFGENDFNPLKNDELKQHDPVMHTTLEQLWPD